MRIRTPWLSALLSLGAVVSLAAASAADQELPKQGVRGRIKLEKTISLPEPAKLVVISKDSGNPATLVVTESNKVLAGSGSGNYREVFRPAKLSNKIFAMPDTLGRSLGITEEGPGGAFYLFDSAGKQLAKILKLSGYRFVHSEPRGPLILSHPTGGWPGWPSIWRADGTRHEEMQKGWPADHVVSVIRFSPDATKIGVMSVREPFTSDFALRIYSSTGKSLWQEAIQQDSATADFMFSRRGRLIGLATASELRIITSAGKPVKTIPVTTRSNMHIEFSGDERHVILASANTLYSISVADGKVSWSWDARSLQEANALSSGTVHITRVVSSNDGQTVGVSGWVSVRSREMLPEGIETDRVDVVEEFVAVVRKSSLVDVLRFPVGTLLKDLSLSRAGSVVLAISDGGDRLIIPTPRAVLGYAISR